MNVEKQNSLFIEAHENAVRHGFWENNPSKEHFLCLVLCELAEAVEAKRTNKQAQLKMFEWAISKEQPAENVEAHWKYCFERFVKDSLGDELADAYIRLCDLAGSYHIVAKEHHGLRYYIVAKELSFTENVLALANVLTDGEIEFHKRVLCCMEQVERLAELEEIDLEWHIENKMRYNKLRQHKHGKAF